MIIEDNIPMPPRYACRKGAGGRPRRYPKLLEMEVGQSILIEGAVGMTIYNSIRYLHKTTAKRFETRRMNRGTRVWRTE